VTPDYDQAIAQARAEWEDARERVLRPARPQGTLLHQAEVIRILNDACGPRSVIVHAAGGLPGDLHKLWRSRGDGDYHSEYGYSCMGYEIAGALGVKMARPDREVYAVLGDGSYLMLNHEIVTSLQEGHKITVVLLDNHGYQCIHNLQRSCGSGGFGNEFRQRDPGTGRLTGANVTVDFVANARSLGAAAFSAGSEDELSRALDQAKQETRTCLIYVQVEPKTPLPGYSWWDVPVAAESESAEVQAARRAYQKALRSRRFYH
jgi:3D-(3,5/4)-trihydroxycyclohexane-1,2-dione acylhydrolase (decyclizing)